MTLIDVAEVEVTTPAETARLCELERVIERGQKTFVEVGNALMEIREARLYRNTHGTFEAYCRQRWGFEKSHANRLMDAAEVITALASSPIGEVLPTNEAQARPLAVIEPEHRAEVWQRVVETAPEGKVTARHVSEVAQEFKAEASEIVTCPTCKRMYRGTTFHSCPYCVAKSYGVSSPIDLNEKLLPKRELSPEQVQAMRDRMAPKMERLKALEAQGVYIGSVWSFGPRENYAGNGSYHGNSIPQIVENAVLLYTEPDALVVDPMAGSGTTVDVCEALGRRCLAFDIQPANERAGVMTANAMDLREFVDDESADMVFWHPPYWNMVVYSREDGDISAMSWAGFLDASRKVLQEIKRMLKPTAALVMLSGDKVQGGQFYPVARKLANIAEEIGLIDSGVAIKTTVNSTSQIVKGRTIWAELAHTGNLKVEHDTINVFRKSA